MLAIISTSNDLHALAVLEELRKLGQPRVAFLRSDQVAANEQGRIEIVPDAREAVLASVHGVAIDELSTIWFRRPRSANLNLDDREPKEREFIDNECRGLINSLVLFANPLTKWISHPQATFRACDKLYQLQVAHLSGFRVPRTLVTQSKADLIRFWEDCKRRIIVKPLVGVREPFLLARPVEDPRELDEEAVGICPAVYQEFIPGTRHIRLNCFGERFLAAAIDSTDLDWRPNLNVPITAWNVPRDLRKLVRSTLDALGLEMGIIDLKQTPVGDLVWLEVNPQGQFLFLDPLLEVNTARLFAEYLLSCETERHRESKA
jgi:hypothetical protein